MAGNLNSGRKKTPTVLAELHGQPGHRKPPIDEPQGQGLLWAPPIGFDDQERDQWHYALEHAPPGLLTGTDLGLLSIWCVAAVQHARALAEVHAHGQVVKTGVVTTTNPKTGVVTTTGGNVVQNPFLGIVNRQAGIMMKAGSEMGFSPAARASLGSSAPEFSSHGGPTAKPNRLAAYLEQKPDKLN